MMSDTKYDYDVIVIGAGPAGANFARLVYPHRYRVLVIDGSQGHDKVCGGLLSPDAQNTLARIIRCCNSFIDLVFHSEWDIKPSKKSVKKQTLIVQPYWL